ncbi:mucin-2 isoform X2 [Lagopus muta]|uniref:mucin-2 isoform X2 n=1 Tax=Lagopus muta TaxID=64668 RepID=UPI00209EA722|nr:mucin-2 isoform X2 [Lagopus muta]
MGLCVSWLVTTRSKVQMAGRTRNHGHYVCSTWGNNHFKTFDGDIYQFPGTCEYNFVSDCQDSYREFSVHIQRALNSNNHPEIQYILVTVTDFTVYLKPDLAVVDGRIVKTPYYSSSLLIENNGVYMKVYAKVGLILIWNQEDALMVELDSKFGNQTCGLCGDYNGVPIYNEFISGVASYNSITYGNLQKISKPNDECEDPDETQALPSCTEHRDECEKLLTSSAFTDCHSLLNLETYIQACMQDKCSCEGNEDSFCLCSTISEYSRQCSHAGGRPGEWRTENFCYKTCPGNMVYRESSSPCMDTCSHLEISSLCEEHYMDGCFCPEGTVYDDINENGCVPVSECYCKLHGKGYSPGETISNECEECTCDSGRWTCQDLPCPGTCSVEGGSHITTFDGKKYTFHGDCYYVLAKSAVNNTDALLAELAPCGSTDGQTCLKTVVLLADDKKNVVVFRSDGSVSLNEMTVNVPHVSASFSVFKPSSYYLVVHTSFGLQLQIQLSPVMQLFVTANQTVQDLQGLCGNFNGMEGDDFKTTSGLVEATGSAFANTWKAQSTCADQEENLEDPCSLSIESANYAEHWCSLLKNSEGPFASCHSVIDPAEYYKRCKYDTCLCKDSEECLCAALSSYSRACAFKGIILGGWRQSVCSAEVSSCPGNQVFLYNLTMCQQTCRSVADGEKYCLQDFAPVDGCGCPDDTYLDNEDTCVPISKCPCYYKGSYLEPGDYVVKDGERCVCRNAKVQCTSVTTTMKSVTECSSNKTYFDCNTSPDWTSQTPVQLRCGASQTDLYQSECVSGCVCPEGLFDDGRGGCVVEEDCPCIHNNDWYNHGQSISVDCNTCTCQKGIWSCTENVCYGTCMIYGSGHYITFDGKFYDFDGSCEYVATQDYCGDKNSGGSFSIITENVPCGTTGVTCSKAIKMFIGKTELKLENKDYKEIQRDVGDDVYYQNKTVGLYLVIEASNGVMLIWDKKTTVFIKLTPAYKGKVCGLCGNFDDKSNNDFTSRSGLQETSALEFGNSWKQSSVCPDVTEEIKPCDLKPHRKSWAEKECSLILSEIFKICHSKVNPSPFYDACVHDACSCDSGGDCDCFCSAVAAYAQECTKAQACVFWRSPDICPIFCDYYNPRNECEWHYEPCGSNVMTCRMIYNVSTNFSVPYLEGCYPRCPHEKPIYNEETKECVAADECWCYHNGNPVIIGGEIPTEENCTKCICRPSGSIECSPIPGCPCVINGTSYDVGETVATIKDGDICTIYVCAENGSVIAGGSYPCPLTTSPSTITTSPGTSTITTIVTTSPPVTTTPCLGLICDWSEWFDVSNPEEDGGDYETYEEIRKEHGNKICTAPENIECRAKDSPDKTLEELGQKVECNVTYGLICKNEEQDSSIWHLCYNYEIRVNCCEWHEIPCGTASTPSSTPTASSVTTGTTVPTTTTRQSTTITTTPTPTATTTSQPTSSVTTPVTSASTVSTAAPTPTPSESPTSTATTTPFSSSTQGTTPTVPGVSSSTPTVTSTVPPTIVTQTHSPPPSLPATNCECIWTDWIDSSQPDRSDVNSGDYEIIDKINNSSLVCVKAENITCRAKDYPNISLEELGQKVECSVNTGLICNNKDQENNSNISYCHNYEISICCTPNKPECIPTPEFTTAISTTVSHSTTTTIVFTSTVSSTTAPPTPTTSAPTTTSGTTLSSSTASSTVSTTPITSWSTSGPTSVSTSTPRPTPTTSLTPPPTTTEGTSSYSTTGSFSSEGTTTVSESSSTASVSTPISTQTTAASSPLLTPSGSMSPTSVSTVPSTVTTSGTTPTKPFTTTSGTTSSSSSTVTATSITTSEIVSSGSATTSGTTPISSTVSVSGSSTYSTVTTLSTLSSTTSASSNCTISPDESYAPGESWWLCNCTKAICVENNTVVIVPVICEPPPKPTCSNGLAPVQVIDDDQCCWHWECDCYCTGWGDPHYLTFDGLYYSYQGNCTYVLVEEIEKTVDNFGIYIDNYHCDAEDVVSCPRALIVRHETQEVRIETVKPNTLEVEVTVNKQAVALPYKKFGLKIYESGINSVVEIPELKMNVTFNGLTFSIRMPYSLFGNNTQGQCGTCSNNTADDCRLPNGNIAENCETMADYWQVVDPSKPQCSPGLTPTKAPSTTTGKPCKESSLCELLWGSVFEKCHGVVNPDKYYAACVFDSCMLPDLDLECSSLQIYAAVCADQNVCIDWRSHTNGVCSYECSKHKEYRACGPIQETTCKSSTQNETSVKQVEGCFCPDGTMLYDSGVDVCVNTCGCVGLDLIPREFGEEFVVDCQDCVCLEGGNGIVCEPHECPEQNIRSCSGKGFYEVTEVNSEDSCCPIVTCKCNTSLCTTEPPKCTLGFEVQSYIPSDECCPVYQCVPKNVCVHQNAEFLPNSSVFVDKCHDCFCTNEVNISTQLNVISCEHIPCNTYCEPGYELKEVEGECCGKCVQTKCIIHTSHGSSLILNPGEFTSDPYNNCTIYSCTDLKNQLISSTSEIMCPAFSEESCKPGTVTLLPNGCCKTCVPLDSPTPCFVREREDFIVYKNCRSLERVVLTECEGTCETFSLYSVEASSMEHSCSCCKEVETSMKEVELQCPSGKTITHKYVYVESCGCQDTQCVVSESSESQSTEENDESTRNHRRRAISLT